MTLLTARDTNKCVIISHHTGRMSMTASIVDVMDGIKMVRLKGKVAWFNDAKGFGFIQAEELKSDVFVHYSAIITDGFKTLCEGDKVEFDLRLDTKNISASNVVRIGHGLPISDDNDECDHSDHDDGYCLDCGEDMTEYLIGRAEHYSDILNDR